MSNYYLNFQLYWASVGDNKCYMKNILFSDNPDLTARLMKVLDYEKVSLVWKGTHEEH